METIAAISTGHTLSAVGILRVSGDDCFSVCDRVFRPLNGRPFSAQIPREMVLGSLLDREGRTIDQVLAEANVATTPGAGFGPSGEGYVRLTAFGGREATKTAVERVCGMFR